MCPNEFIMYEDSIKILWYYKSLKSFKDSTINGRNFEITGGIQFRNINKDFILYQNEEYESEINKLLNEKDLISENSSKALYYRYENLINEILSDNKIEEKIYKNDLSLMHIFLLFKWRLARYRILKNY